MSNDSVQPTPVLAVFPAYGRYYGLWRQEKYLFPIDAEETNRMDMFHQFFLVARHDALYLPNLPVTRSLRIMDLGTGTGIWANHVAERTNPEPEIMAVDLHKIQAEKIPPGVTAVQFDIEDPCWGPLMKHCDLVHLRMLFGSVHPPLWSQIYRNIHNHLLPGSGYLEHVEIDWVPRWDEGDGGEIPVRSALEEWSTLFFTALERLGRNARIDRAAIRKTIEDAGFTDFKEETIRGYMGPWMPDKNEQIAAKWLNLCFSRGVEAMSLMPMIKGLGMDMGEVSRLCERAVKETLQLRFHTYFNVHIWSARRPSIDQVGIAASHDQVLIAPRC
ncbi:hypothetical protein J3458_019932 [Metarhizium acridum]|uniref:uncharacterized protein n=1 Tax=Metarhizium acridum TaxID=92637 RepID=UPI001C6C7A17|nr:hypothetical protein J3458_019932 [Metarhizium acridum]